MKQEYDEIMEEQRREADIELPDKHDPKPEMVCNYAKRYFVHVVKIRTYSLEN